MSSTPSPLTPEQRGLASLYRGDGLPHASGARPRVAVVGAGLAGLTAARLAMLGGCATRVFEAADRIGGRTRTERGGVDPATVWEMGGEFIDGDHDDMHGLAHALGIEVIDTLPAADDDLETAYRFGGRAIPGAHMEAAFADAARRIATDAASITRRPSYRAPSAVDLRFDRLSLAEYLDGLDLDRSLRSMIDASYVALYGLDAGEQSALNLLTLFSATAGSPEIFGTSDERYKIREGSQCLADAMARDLGERVALGQRLVRLRRAGAEWQLAFDRGAQARADAVVLALPFTLLRQVDLGDLLPPPKRAAVDELGYGASSKVMIGMQRPVWRDLGFDGECCTDEALQTSWDSSRHRERGRSVFTVYLGGSEALAAGQGTPQGHADRYARIADAVFPGFASRCNGEVRRAHWASEPLALGAYTCYRPGQWTRFGGVEGEPLPDGLYFAGEHCAAASQGYMNGAVETGRAAALSILRR